MENPLESTGDFDTLKQLASLGYEFVLLRPGEKRPWYQGWQQREVTLEKLDQSLGKSEANVGIKTGGSLIVLDVDTDDPDKLDWIKDNVGDTPMKVRTPSGGAHYYFRTRKGVSYGNKVKMRGEPFDFRHEGGFVVCPPSQTKKGDYRWLGKIVPVSELPVLRVSALRERRSKRKLNVIEPSEYVEQKVRQARSYISKIVSVAGECGHNACFRAACRCRDFGLTPQQTLQLLLVWNQTNAHPPWSEDELQHKVDDAYKVNPRSD